MELVRIDGSYGEGGGQVLRTCLSLAAGASRFIARERTLHLDTNAWVIQQFLGERVGIDGDGPAQVTVEGIGLGN